MSGAPTTPTAAVPVLPVSDLVRAVAWYERIGFVVQATFDGYAILAFDGTELHLAEFDDLPGPQQTWSGAYLRVVDADAVFARWTAMGAPTIAVPADQPYGIREFATEDLDGNLWRVGAPLAANEPDLPAEPAPTPKPTAPPPLSTEDRADGGPGTSDAQWFAIVSGDGHCAGCGLAPGELHERALGAEVRDLAHAFGEDLLAADDEAVRRRPAPETWSPLEYGVHVRDMLAVFAERIVRMMAEHDPELGWWDHEAAIADGMANESDVSAVADDLGRNAAKLSEALRMVGDDDWSRTGTRRGTERFTIELAARFALHETVHHRADGARALLNG